MVTKELMFQWVPGWSRDLKQHKHIIPATVAEPGPVLITGLSSHSNLMVIIHTSPDHHCESVVQALLSLEILIEACFSSYSSSEWSFTPGGSVEKHVLDSFSNPSPGHQQQQQQHGRPGSRYVSNSESTHTCVTLSLSVPHTHTQGVHYSFGLYTCACTPTHALVLQSLVTAQIHGNVKPERWQQYL